MTILNKVLGKKVAEKTDFTAEMDILLAKYNIRGYIALGSDINMKFRDDMVLREITHIMNIMDSLTTERDRQRLLKHMTLQNVNKAETKNYLG